jgi:uncharacterized protein (DUF362 family)
MIAPPRKVHCARIGVDLNAAIRAALDGAGVLARIKPGARVALKPNFTHPVFKQGVTTSPQVIRETVRVLKDFTTHVAIVESDGGYGAWSATDAFAGHELAALQKEFGIEAVNLCAEPARLISFRSGENQYQLPLPVRLLDETDLLISMPVPKIHCMTGLTLSYKNQWGCIPDTMRLRRHYIFNAAIVAINKALRPAVLSDGTFFLDRSGPIEGQPVRMDLIVAASDCGAFDRYVSELMGWNWRNVGHLRHAVKENDMPAKLEAITCNAPPQVFKTQDFKLHRTLRAWIALGGFKSRFLTWLGYESWFGKGPLHWMLYALVGKPSKQTAEPE